MTKTEIEQIKVISNYGYHKYTSFFDAEDSYLQFDGYNEFFNNTLTTATEALSIYVQEGIALNFTLNTIIIGFFCILVIITIPSSIKSHITMSHSICQ